MREVIADLFVRGGLAAIIAAAWQISPPCGIAGIGVAGIGVGLLISGGRHDSEQH